MRRLLAHARAATAADLTRASDAAVASLAGDGNAQGVMPRPVDRAELRIRAGAAVDALRTTAELPGDTVTMPTRSRFSASGRRSTPQRCRPSNSPRT